MLFLVHNDQTKGCSVELSLLIGRSCCRVCEKSNSIFDVVNGHNLLRILQRGWGASESSSRYVDLKSSNWEVFSLQARTCYIANNNTIVPLSRTARSSRLVIFLNSRTCNTATEQVCNIDILKRSKTYCFFKVITREYYHYSRLPRHYCEIRRAIFSISFTEIPKNTALHGGSQQSSICAFVYKNIWSNQEMPLTRHRFLPDIYVCSTPNLSRARL